MIDVNKYKELKDEVKIKKEELQDSFLAKNENIADLQKKKDDLFIKYGLKSPDLDTSSGLYQVALDNGLEKQANKIIQDNSGEEYKKIFSGGFISDIFDVLNTVSYGVVGTLKGKGFVEGVKNRESFADDDAMGQYGLTGAIAGIALDIATDPLTYVAPWTIAKKLPGVAKGVKIGKEATFGKMVTKAIDGSERTHEVIEGGTVAGKKLAEKFVYMFGADGVYKDIWKKMTTNIGVGTVTARDMMRGISKIDKELSSKLGDTLFTNNDLNRLIRKPLSEIQRNLDQKSFEKVKAVYDDIDSMGKELVDLGVLKGDKYEENLGEYMHQYYRKYTDAQKPPFGGGLPSIKGTKKRSETLTKEGIEALDRIEDPAYVLGRTMIEMQKDIEYAKLFNKVDELYAVTKEIPGFTKLPSVTRLGNLSEKYVPDYIAKNLLPEMLAPVEKTMADRVMAEFKFAKVILSPAAMARNGISNLILNYWKLGVVPGSKHYLKAAKEIKDGGGKLTELFSPLGYKADSFAANEIYSIMDVPSSNKAKRTIDNIKDKFANFYQAEESFAKLAAASHQLAKGLSPEEAWKMAESATFNYAEVTPFVRKLRTSAFGFPFITFPIKATPLAIETALKKPGRISVIGKIRNAIEEQSDYDETMREKETEAQWIKDGFFVKLPIKDSEGRSAFFDLTYILPFGDLVSGQFTERGVSRKTGVKESVAVSALSKNPLFNFLKEVSRNQDFSGRKIWKDSDSAEKQLAELSRHLFKSFAPPPIADQVPGGYTAQNERVKSGVYAALTKEDEANQKRTLAQELMKNVGIKIQPIDAEIQESMNEWQKKKGMNTLLQDNNIVSDFRSSYISK